MSRKQRYYPRCFDCKDKFENTKDVELEKDVRYGEGRTVYVCPHCGSEYKLRHYDVYKVRRLRSDTDVKTEGGS